MPNFQNDAEPSAYEKEREDNINRNKRRMEELVQSSSVDTPPKVRRASMQAGWQWIGSRKQESDPPLEKGFVGIRRAIAMRV